MSNKLAVIIPAFNKVYWTQKTIESLLKNSYYEVTLILVDDASGDETFNYALELGERLNHFRQRFFYLKHPHNMGVTAAWNTGLGWAMAIRAEYICIANNDLLFSPSWDAPLMEALDNGYSLVSPYSTEQRLPADWPDGADRHTNPVGIDILGACFMFKPELIQQIGYFPPQLHIYFNDNWILEMCKVRGLKYGHIKESYIHHFFCQTTATIGLDNNALFASDGKAFNDYCRDFVLGETPLYGIQ
jgi:glycosyltransferase involved in cell wall biosynthesis